MKALLAESDDPTEIFFALAIDDVRDACDVLRPVWERRAGEDGYVSLEVDPTLANKTDETLQQAIELHDEVDRPNVYDQDPGHARGAAGDRGLDRARRLDQHHADLLARALRGGRRGVHPRPRAARRRRRRPVEGRLGRVVLRLAHRHRDRQAPRSGRQHASCRASSGSPTRSSPTSTSSEAFAGPRWERLAAKGALVQRPLWASTSTKNPAYRTSLYVEELIGPDTVNTMPPETVTAFQDHGDVRGDTVLEGWAEAERLLERAARGRASTTTTSCRRSRSRASTSSWRRSTS